MQLLDPASLPTMIDEIAAGATAGRQDIASTDLSLSGIAALRESGALVAPLGMMLDSGFDATTR